MCHVSCCGKDTTNLIRSIIMCMQVCRYLCTTFAASPVSTLFISCVSPFCFLLSLPYPFHIPLATRTVVNRPSFCALCVTSEMRLGMRFSKRCPTQWDRWYRPKHVKSWSFTSGRPVRGRPVVTRVSSTLEHFTTRSYCLRAWANGSHTSVHFAHFAHFRKMSRHVSRQLLK